MGDVVELDETSSMKEGRTPVLRLGDRVRVALPGVRGVGTVTALDVKGITDDPDQPMVRVKVGTYPHEVHVAYAEAVKL